MEYNVIPDKKIPMYLTAALFISGVVTAILPTIFKDLPALYFQVPAMLLFLSAVLLYSRFGLTTYSYQLYDESNDMSPYPKLNVYRVRKNESKMVYCIPFNNIISVTKTKKVDSTGIPRENLCASMFPKEVYRVYYTVDTKEAIFLECNDAFAKEIAKRIRQYSEVPEEDGEEI